MHDDDLKDGLVAAGETYEKVDSFCYLGDMLSAEGGVDAAVTTRVRSAWKKFRELVPFLTSKAPSLKMKGQVYTACVRSCMLYGSEAWALKAEHEMKLERTEMRMIRWMSGVSLQDRRTSQDLRSRVGVVPINDITRRNRLRWFGHVQRKEDNDWVKKCTSLHVEGPTPTGRPRKTWHHAILQGMELMGTCEQDTQDRVKWRRAISGMRAHPAAELDSRP